MFESGGHWNPLTVLMAIFLLVILAYGWMARRQAYLRSQLAERQGEYERLGAAAATLAEEVSQCRHGISANTLSVRNLQGEVTEFEKRIELFLQEHPELKREYQGLTADAGVAPPPEQT